MKPLSLQVSRDTFSTNLKQIGTTRVSKDRRASVATIDISASTSIIMTSRVNPLEVPELVAMILYYISIHKEKAQLAKCALVNKLWAAQATSLLWKEPRLCYFSKYLSVARQPHYASKVHTIKVHDSKDLVLLGSLGRDLHLPRLKKLYVNGHRLQPYMKVGAPEVALLSFLQARPSIESIVFHHFHDPVVGAELLRHLSNRQGLKLLSLPYRIRHQDLPSLTLGSSYPFRSLRTLYLVYTKVNVITQLLPLLPHLRELVVRELRNDDILAHVAQCSNLRSLRIEFAHKSRISGHDLVSLAQRCQELQELMLYAHDDKEDLRLLLSDVSDADIECLASHLKHLTSFELGSRCPAAMPTTITIQSLKSLALHCPNLEICVMPGAMPVVELGLESPCLFPKLMHLAGMNKMSRAQTEVDPTLRGITLSVLEHHFPRLLKSNMADLIAVHED